ncbi:hypothetical protein LZ198_38275 [Myxococcus sp. K15C18031901]|uniref:hypothetical protein n=1 Tax=Myxococcus dinghuensis TaxID=2906761 RepID=UPI0020A73C5F|nr:hypothetical protein [Myxococcus dinghuensis]MCP3104729.1 hypothetical protein [Myxococcus dinghuensis]
MRPSFLQTRGALAGALVALGLLSGCGDSLTPETVDLAGLADRTLTYALNDVDAYERLDAPGAHRFTVTFSLAGGDRCTDLRAGTTATLNGVSMRLEPGGVDGTAGRDLCLPTRAYYDFDPSVWAEQAQGDLRVVLQDPTHSVALTLRGGKAKRTFQYEGAGTADRLMRGQTYSFGWRPDGEVPESVGVTLLREDGLATATVPATLSEGSVSFTILANTPVSTYLLTLSGATRGVVSECSGVARCEGAIIHSEERVVGVQ